MNPHIIQEWFNDNFENIEDICNNFKMKQTELYKQYHALFGGKIKKQTFDNFKKEVIENCTRQTNQSYEDCSNVLKDKLHKMWGFNV